MIPTGLIESVLRASIIAVIPLLIWAFGRFGSKKTWYFQTSSTSIAFGVARFWYYVSPFLGISFLIMGVSDYYLGHNPNSSSIWLYFSMACIPIGFVCGFLQPDWLSPGWLRRLKREYGEAIPWLLEDAFGISKVELDAKTRKWEDLEKWVEEVRNKNDERQFPLNK